jgi:aldehyde dehydrogenase (NAD+)
VVLKAAPETPWSAALLGEAAAGTDLPPGVLNVITGGEKTALGEQLVADPRVDLISFTGSTATGRRIMAAAAGSVKRVFLELGGKSANILLDDADFGQALHGGLAVCYHAGQGCSIPTRMLVPRAQLEEAVVTLKTMFESLPYGDPDSREQILGPVISKAQRERVLGFVDTGKREGARLVTGGGIPPHLPRGFYVEPTLFAGVDNRMRIAQEEIFGPVLAVIAHDGDDDAVRIANESIYGLAGAVHSADRERALSVARRLRAGTVNVNTGNAFDADAPFGGYRQSGIGREMGVEGFEEYLETKTVGLPA